MMIIHLTNTDFEFELLQSDSRSIEEVWTNHPLCLQLQFLPLLYAKEDELIAVTSFPDPLFLDSLLQHHLWKKRENLPQLISLLSSECYPEGYCLSWGFSKRVQRWAKQKEILYEMPKWEVVQEVNSKLFSFQQRPLLPQSALIWNESDLVHWLSSYNGKKVIKTCFGVSGRGHYFVNDSHLNQRILRFCNREWEQQRPVIGEPWLERLLDFSTQWELSQAGSIELIGTTIFETDSHGIYRGTSAGPAELLLGSFLPFLKEHQQFVQPALRRMASMGFFGPVGIDALIYQNQQKEPMLYPIVEINARQTMSLAALKFQKRWFPDHLIQFSFISAQQKGASFLPMEIQNRGKKTVFNKKLLLSLSVNQS